MIAKELVIDGIRPPPPSVLYTQQQQQQQQHQTTPVSVVQQVQVANTQVCFLSVHLHFSALIFAYHNTETEKLNVNSTDKAYYVMNSLKQSV